MTKRVREYEIKSPLAYATHRKMMGILKPIVKSSSRTFIERTYRNTDNFGIRGKKLDAIINVEDLTKLRRFNVVIDTVSNKEIRLDIRWLAVRGGGLGTPRVGTPVSHELVNACNELQKKAEAVEHLGASIEYFTSGPRTEVHCTELRVAASISNDRVALEQLFTELLAHGAVVSELRVSTKYFVSHVIHSRDPKIMVKDFLNSQK